jgi:Zn-dependent protease with chaperone function
MKNKISKIFTIINTFVLLILTIATYLIFSNYIETISTSTLATTSFLHSFMVKQNYAILLLGFLLLTGTLLKEKIKSKNITLLINGLVLFALVIYSYWFYNFLTNHLQNLIISTTNQ